MNSEPNVNAIENVLSFLNKDQLLALYTNVTEGAAPLIASKDICKCGCGECSCNNGGAGCSA